MTLFNSILSLLSIWSVLVPALLGAGLYRKIALPSKIIWVMTVLAVFPQLVRYLSFMNGYRYLFYNIYLVAEVALYVCYFNLLLRSRKQKKILLIFPIAFSVIYLTLCFYKSIAVSFFNEAVCIDNLFVLFYVLVIALNNYSESKSFFYPINSNVYFLIGVFFLCTNYYYHL